MAQIFKNAGTKIARLPGVQPTLDAAAAKILANATALASAHIKTTSYVNSLKVQPARGRSGVMDRLVIATDPAAVHIEYGHLQRSKTGGTWVPGQYILTRSIRG